MFKQYKLRNYKFILVMYVMILNVIGILLIGSAKPSVQSKQILGMIAGLTIMVMLSLIDYNFILKFSGLLHFLLPESHGLFVQRFSLFHFLQEFSPDG